MATIFMPLLDLKLFSFKTGGKIALFLKDGGPFEDSESASNGDPFTCTSQDNCLTKTFRFKVKYLKIISIVNVISDDIYCNVVWVLPIFFLQLLQFGALTTIILCKNRFLLINR